MMKGKGFFSHLDNSSDIETISPDTESIAPPTQKKGRGFFSHLDEEKKFGKKGKIVGGKVGSAIESISKRPSQLIKEIPTAALQTSEDLSKFSDPTSLILSSLGLENPYAHKLSEEYKEFIREGMTPEEKEQAQDLADIEQFLIPSPLGKVKGMPHIPVPQKALKISEKLSSGLTKPAIMEGGKLAKYATVNARVQKKAFANLEKESQKLLRESIHKNVPFSKEIEAGKDFSSYFKNNFKNLRTSMNAANPEIDITPLSKFFSDTRAEYGSLANPSRNKKMILNEIRKFRKKPSIEGKELLETYRDNNEKIGEILETPLLGKKKRYLDFLLESNRKIEESFSKTLPENSKWMENFRKVNKEFSQHANAKEVLSKFDDLLGEKVNSGSLRKLANEPGRQNMLRFKIGEKPADEIIQLATDLEKASLAIKKMPQSTLKKFGGIEWLMTVLPGGKKLLGLKKGIDASREIYGKILMSPKKTKVFREALNALESGDVKEWNLLVPQLQRLWEEE